MKLCVDVETSLTTPYTSSIVPTLTTLPDEGVIKILVTVARNAKMERFAVGEGGVARSVSDNVAFAVLPPPPPPVPPPPPLPLPPPPPAPVLPLPLLGVDEPLHAEMQKTKAKERQASRTRFMVEPLGEEGYS